MSDYVLHTVIKHPADSRIVARVKSQVNDEGFQIEKFSITSEFDGDCFEEEMRNHGFDVTDAKIEIEEAIAERRDS